MNSVINGLLIFGFLFFIFSKDQSFAYFDPGTGSYILQVVAATFFAGIFVMKMGWRHITSFFSHLFKSGKKDEKKTSKKDTTKE